MSFFSSVRGNLGATGRGIIRRNIPSWVTAAGALAGSPTFDSQRATKSYSVNATLAGETITYSVVSGSLPAGMSLNSSTGAITGTASAVGSDTTSNFTIRATGSGGGTEDRAFSVQIKAPVVTSFTATGASTFSVPTGVTSVQVLVVAGGGSGGGIDHHSGGGGAGGMVENNTFPVSPGGNVSVTVGAGGGNPPQTGNGNPGNNSVFGNITALGGGGGASYNTGSAGLSGGSGGGGAGNTFTLGGPGTQGPSGGGTGNGTPGGAGSGPAGGGGGGGGGGAGQPGYNGGGRTSPALPNPGINWQGGKGGDGRISNITGSPVYYGGGGGGSSFNNTSGGWTLPQGLAAGGLGGGGQGGWGESAAGAGDGQPGQPGTGGGGGAGERVSSGGSGNQTGLGGTGIVIVRY